MIIIFPTNLQHINPMTVHLQLLLLPFILPILTCIFLPNSDQHYTLSSTNNNPHGYQHYLSTNDMTLAFLYDRSSNLADVFVGYNWQSINDTKYSDFIVGPSQISCFVSDAGQYYFLYGSDQGQIISKKVIQGKSSKISILWTIQDEQNNVVKVIPTADLTLYAAFCQNSNKVQIGDLFIAEQPKVELNYTGAVRSIQWQTGTRVLAIAGQTHQKQPFLFLYDYDDQNQEDLSHSVDSLIAGMAFSKDGNTLFSIQNDLQKQAFKLSAYNLSNGSVSILLESFERQYREVSVRGQFVSVWDGQYVYILNKIQNEYIYQGQYPSRLNSNGLSPDGGELVTLSADSTKIVLYKICLNRTVYDSKTDTCLQCKLPCQQCFLTPNSCSSCSTSAYLTPAFTCQECVSSLKGCTRCLNSTYCTQCNSDQHWTLNITNHNCTCATSYVQINNQCLSCPKHCLRCSNATYCQLCDDNWTQVWSYKKSYCVCARGFLQTNESCTPCSSLISHCLLCSSSSVCTSCSWQYDLKDNQCQEQSNYVLIVVFGVVGVVLLGLLGFCLLMVRDQQRRIRGNRRLVEENE